MLTEKIKSIEDDILRLEAQSHEARLRREIETDIFRKALKIGVSATAALILFLGWEFKWNVPSQINTEVGVQITAENVPAQVRETIKSAVDGRIDVALKKAEEAETLVRKKAAAIDAMFKQIESGGLVAAAESRKCGESYTATTAGFVYATLDRSGPTAEQGTLFILGQLLADEGARDSVKTICSALAQTGTDEIRTSSIIFPVQRGQSWRVALAESHGESPKVIEVKELATLQQKKGAKVAEFWGVVAGKTGTKFDKAPSQAEFLALEDSIKSQVAGLVVDEFLRLQKARVEVKWMAIRRISLDDPNESPKLSP
jgi:hypothetical protein